MTKETQELNLIKSKDDQEDHSNPSTSKQTHQNETQCSSFTTKITPNLPSMPFEIKEKIVYWVYWLHLPGSSNSTEVLKNGNDNNDGDDDDQFEDISDSDSETRYDKWKTQSNHKPNQTNKKSLSTSESDSGSTHSDRSGSFSSDSDDDCLIDIRSLAFVDRTFYQLCCPYLYQSFDSQGYTVEKLKFTLEEIIKPHSNHVKKLWWRVSKSELVEFESIWNDDLLDEPEWDPKSRSEVLLQIFQTCLNIIDLDVDLDPEVIIPLPEPSDSTNDLEPDTSSSPSGRRMPNLFIKPISQLTSLTHLALTSPTERPAYSERFLVDIILNLSQLQSFGCSRVAASYPKPTDDRPECLSPLGIHLASLTGLIELDFEQVECLDSSWNSLEWKSSLKEITLEDCQRVSIPVLHGFLKLFQFSLVSLSLDNVPFHDNANWNSYVNLEDVYNDSYKFDLPKLTNLEVSNYIPVRFLRSFQPCKNITEIALDETPAYKHRDLEELIQDRVWPNLKKLSITSRTAYLSPGEIESLEVLCQGYEIEMSLDSSDDEDDEVDVDYDDDDELDLDEEEEFEEDHWAHHFGQDDDDDDDLE